jgi:hypothetical protein
VLARHGAHDASEAAAHGSAQTPTFLVFRAIRDARVAVSVSGILDPHFWGFFVLGLKCLESVESRHGWPVVFRR